MLRDFFFNCLKELEIQDLPCSFFPSPTVTGPVVFINAGIFHSFVKHHGGGRFHSTLMLLSLVILVIPVILHIKYCHIKILILGK